MLNNDLNKKQMRNEKKNGNNNSNDLYCYNNQMLQNASNGITKEKRQMRLSKFSKGITNVNGKNYQVGTANAALIVVQCPYCGADIEITDDQVDTVVICEEYEENTCGREFFAEWNY